MNARIEMNRATLEAAFDAMGVKAAGEGPMLEILVFGGSRLVLASDFREATGDVDAVHLDEDADHRARAQQMADEVQRERPDLRLQENWLNQAVKTLVDPDKGVRRSAGNLFNEYPRETRPSRLPRRDGRGQRSANARRRWSWDSTNHVQPPS